MQMLELIVLQNSQGLWFCLEFLTHKIYNFSTLSFGIRTGEFCHIVEIPRVYGSVLSFSHIRYIFFQPFLLVSEQVNFVTLLKFTYSWIMMANRTVCHHLVKMRLGQMVLHRKSMNNNQLSGLIIQKGRMNLNQEP